MSRREPFAPSERATAVTPEGQRVAEYEIIAGGSGAGETKVWSTGAFEEETADDRDRTLIHVAFALEGTNQRPLELELDKVALDGVEAGGRTFTVAHPTYVEGSAATVEDDKEAEIHLYFAMPPGVKPQSVDAFRVRWSVRAGDERYQQRTPFLESEVPPYPYYYHPYYDDWYWRVDPWGY